MAYYGTKPVNSPLKQETGERNKDAYQEQVFAKLEAQSYLDDSKLAQYPFSTSILTMIVRVVKTLSLIGWNTH
jgi:SOS response regulatory protein OraA/RecX